MYSFESTWTFIWHNIYLKIMHEKKNHNYAKIGFIFLISVHIAEIYNAHDLFMF